MQRQLRVGQKNAVHRLLQLIFLTSATKVRRLQTGDPTGFPKRLGISIIMHFTLLAVLRLVSAPSQESPDTPRAFLAVSDQTCL